MNSQQKQYNNNRCAATPSNFHSNFRPCLFMRLGRTCIIGVEIENSRFELIVVRVLRACKHFVKWITKTGICVIKTCFVIIRALRHNFTFFLVFPHFFILLRNDIFRVIGFSPSCDFLSEFGEEVSKVALEYS